MSQNYNNNCSAVVISGPCWHSWFTGNSRTKRGLGKVAYNRQLQKRERTGKEYSCFPFFFFLKK